jgi:Serine hydroxymethyltransferase
MVYEEVLCASVSPRTERRLNRRLEALDPPIAELLKEEAEGQATGLELIPSENLVSEAVLDAMGSIFTNKYAEGYPACGPGPWLLSSATRVTISVEEVYGGYPARTP